MKITRKDNVTFVATTTREKLLKNDSRKVHHEALASFQKAHSGRYFVSYLEGDYRYIAFAATAGYSLAGAARHYFGTAEKILWVDKVEDTNDYIFVCLDKGSVVCESITQHIEKYLLKSIFTPGNLPVVVTSTVFPEFLRTFIDSSEGLGTVVEKVEPESILDKLPYTKGIAYRDRQQLESLLESTERNGKIFPKLLIGVAVAAIAGYLLTSGEEEETAVAIIDPYETYKNISNRNSVSGTLSEIYKIMSRIEQGYKWSVSSCEVGENMPLICELTPAMSAKTSDLLLLQKIAGPGAKAALVKNVAHLIVPIVVPTTQRQYEITALEPAVHRVFDNLAREATVSDIDILPAAEETNCVTQVIEFRRENTGLYHLITVANATNGLPVNFQSLKIQRTEYSHSFEYKILAFGGK